MRDPKCDVLAPGRRDDLHADRQRTERHRNGDYRQTDERDRLRVDAEIGTHWQLDTIEEERLLPDYRSGTGGAGCEDGIDFFEQREHMLAIPAAELLRLVIKS